MQEDPKIVDVEVVVEPPPQKHQSPAQHGDIARSHPTQGPPVHPLAALLLVVVDNLWLLPEFYIINWAITIPLCFITVLIPTLLIQKTLKKQTFGAALGYSLLLAVIAAVPTSLLGTPVGAALLAWFGISKLWGGSRDKAIP